MRGATPIFTDPLNPVVISIHAPHAGSDKNYWINRYNQVISIHAPHAGSDVNNNLSSKDGYKFQSTLPMRGATKRPGHPRPHIGISIHAPHAGSDAEDTGKWYLWDDFNPRSPCGERHVLSRGVI